MSKRPTESRRNVRDILGPLYADMLDLAKRVSNLESSEGGSPYILIIDRKTSGTDGGTFTTGAWRTRDLTIIASDDKGIAQLAANQITLPKGAYRLRASAPAFSVDAHQARFYNITNTTEIALGTSESAGTGIQTRSIVSGKLFIGVSSVFELQHRCGSTQATNGFGKAAAWGNEVYSMVELWKI